MLLTKGKREDNWKYNDKVDKAATELAMKYFAVVNYVLLPYGEFEEKRTGMVILRILKEER